MPIHTLRLPAPYPTVTAYETIDLNTGATRYQLTGRRLSGSVTVGAEPWPDTVLAERARIAFGYRGPDGRGPITDFLTINGIETTGGRSVTLQDTYHLDRRSIPMHRRDSRNPIPAPTATYLAVTACAVLNLWTRHPERDALMLAGSRHTALRRLDKIEREAIVPLRTQIDELSAQLRHARNIAAGLTILADQQPADR